MSLELGYSLDLPEKWRRAVCSPGVVRASPLTASEMFVDMPEDGEHIGGGTRMVLVRVIDAQGQTPIAFLEANAGMPDVRVEGVTLNGFVGARAVVVPTGVIYAYALTARGWIYHAERPYFGTEDEEPRRILSTLRLLDRATYGQSPSATPAPRSAEAVADALAEAFAKKDVNAVGLTMSGCLTVGAVPGDASLTSRLAYLKELASQFAGGLTVKVQARPIESDALGRFVRSTWTRPGQSDQRIDFVLGADGDRWTVTAAFARAP